jgi:septum formation protein
LAGFEVIVRGSSVDEKKLTGESPFDLVLRLSEKKALEAGPNPEGLATVGADTVVVLDGEILGKPRDILDARKMLFALSGKVHEVITGYFIFTPKGAFRRRALSTQIAFRNLTEWDVENYLSLGEWADKAGSYAIQSGGGIFTKWINGSYTNIVGLPLAEFLIDFKEISLL